MTTNQYTIHAQDVLRGGRSLEYLTETYGLKIVRGKQYPNLVLFSYDMVRSPMRDPLVRQCRGLILDEANDWDVVSHPFDKFFNYGEGMAAEIDWASASFQEKLDGSMIQVYHHDGAWHAGTTGTPDGSGSVNKLDMTFRDLFLSTFWQFHTFSELTEGFTYIFELVTPQNRNIVFRDGPGVFLLSARNLIDGREQLRPAGWSGMCPPIYPIGSIEDAIASFAAIDPTEREGYVVVDRHFNRVKVKHPGYVRLHHLAGGYSQRTLLDVIRKNEDAELLSVFPQWRTDAEAMRNAYSQLVRHINDDYLKLLAFEPQSQKAFAEHATQTLCPGALFALRNGKSAGIVAYLASMHIDHLLDLLVRSKYLVPETTP